MSSAGPSRRVLGVAAALVACGGLAAPARAAPRAPQVEQLVVFRSGEAVTKRVRAAATAVRVEGRRCGLARATPLAALVRSRPGRIGLEDFGRCTRRGRDSGQLYVRSIRGDREAGRGGWTYKVGRRLGTAGAADPAGPFGSGRLRSGQRVTWFYCVLRRRSCQRTLALRVSATAGGALVRVRAYDDEGKGVAVAGATVTAGQTAAMTDDSGSATLALPPGRYAVRAEKPGLVRSFAERLTVR